MKKLLFIILLLPLFSLAQRTPVAGWNESKIKVLSSNYFHPAMIRLPSDYFDGAASTKRYPAIFIFHGTGQAGTDTVKVLNDGWAKNLSNNGSTSYTHEGTTVTVGSDNPTANDVNGNSRTAIVVAIQHNSYSTAASSVHWALKYVLENYRIDSSMIYLYGFSAGNYPASGYIANADDTTYHRFISAIVVDKGATQDLVWSGVKNIGLRRIPTFLIAGGSDISYRDQMRNERDTINAYSAPDVAIYAEVAGQGHSGFSANTLNSKVWTELGNKNIVTWLFGQRNVYATTWTPPTGGSSPVANAGADQTWNMPKTSTTLNGGGSTGTITSIQWTKISSPNPTHTMEGVIGSPNSLITTISNFGVGIYKYELSISDGVTTSKDTVTITGLPFKSKIPNPTDRKFLLTPSGGEYYFPNVVSSFGPINGTDTFVLTQSANLAQFYGDNGSGGWGGDSVYQVVIMGATPDVTLRQLRLDGQYVKVQDLTFNNPNASPDIALPAKHYAIEITNCTMLDGDNFIYAKAVVDTTNVLTYGDNWDFKYNYFHHNTSEKSNGEWGYFDHTFSDEDKVPQGFGSYKPVKMSNLRVLYNSINNAGWDGIQVSNAPNAEIAYNTIDSVGTAYKSAQANGIILGGYSSGSVHDNDVRNTPSAAIAVFGNDTCKIYNNIIVNGGYADPRFDGDVSGNPFTSIYITDNRVASIGTPSPTLVPVIQNNCIQQITSYTGGAAIENRNTNGTTRPGIISGNKIGDPIGGRLLTNLIHDNSSSTVSGNSLASCSPVNISPNASAGADVSITLPTSFTTLDGSASTDTDGSIASYSWTQVSGPSSANIVLPTSVSTTVANLIAGTYTFRLTVTDNSGATATDDVTVTVSDLVIRKKTVNWKKIN